MLISFLIKSLRKSNFTQKLTRVLKNFSDIFLLEKVRRKCIFNTITLGVKTCHSFTTYTHFTQKVTQKVTQMANVKIFVLLLS